MTTFEVRVQAIRLEADRIRSFELRPLTGHDLPAFTAGAHIEVHLANGIVRSYSLANSPAEGNRYEIAVNKEVSGRGGSGFMHDQVHVGARLRISAPRNNFALREEAEHSVLIAGGIGITPLRSMIARLRALERPWSLLYAGRDRDSMAFLEEFARLRELGHAIRIHSDAEAGAPPDLQGVVAKAPPSAHFYCCGPRPMLAVFEAATSQLPAERVHVEYFAGSQAPALAGEFSVELARSGRVLQVPAGTSILDTLLDAGVNVPYSCMEGVCASCETRVLAGVPDHRDAILSRAERDANDRMMICCSGARTPRLVLDL